MSPFGPAPRSAEDARSLGWSGRYDVGVSARVNTPSFYLETLGCPKNAVDSDKVVASLLADGLVESDDPSEADLVVVNTCAFIEAARQESIDVALVARRHQAGRRQAGDHRLYGRALRRRARGRVPEADAVVGFAGEGTISQVVLKRKPVGVRDLLELPRPAPSAPWAYVKVAEGCDRACAFCAIPTFRGPQRSRTFESIEAEARSLVEAGVAEIVLVAQDLAWYGRDIGVPGSLEPLLRRLDALAPHGLARIRLLYLYPSEVHDPLVSTMLELPTVVPYFDLSLQHASAPIDAADEAMGERRSFRLDHRGHPRPTTRCHVPFVVHVGFPGETESDHDALLAFLSEARLDWAGFFAFSREDGTAAATMDGVVDEGLMRERLGECAEVQDPITNAARRASWAARSKCSSTVSTTTGQWSAGRTAKRRRSTESCDSWDPLDPEVFARPGAIITATVSGVAGPDLEAKPDLDGRLGRTARSGRASPPSASARVRSRRRPTSSRHPNSRQRSRRSRSIRHDGSSWLTVGLWSRSPRPTALTAGSRRDGADAVGRLPRPGRRQADRDRRPRGARRPRRVPVVAGAADRGPRVWHLGLPIGCRPAGIVLPAQRLGKYKAFTQYCAVGFVLLPPTAHDLGAAARSCSRSRSRSRSSRACRSCGTATSTGSVKTTAPSRGRGR